MGIFDIFTGASAKKAAAENTQRLSDLQTTGMGYLDAGKTGALGALDTARADYQPLSDLAGKYGNATNLYQDALGINGAAGNANAVNAFQAGPGYQFGVNQSLDALDRRAAGRGMLASGNNTIDTLGTVTGLANQEYGNWLGRLGGFVSPELQATQGAAGGRAGVDVGRAGVYTNNANNQVGLATGTTAGINNQATQAANAEIAGSGNLWGLGLNLAKLAAGMPQFGGGTAKPGTGNTGSGWYNG